MIGILGKKLGMSHYYDEKGARVPLTVIEAPPAAVLAVMTTEKHGYAALQLGIIDGVKKRKNHPKKKYIKEIRLKADPAHKVGDTISVDVFSEGDHVDISGTSKGKGFQGGMKRWGWRGGEAGHGSMFHRRVGSIGASSFPSRVHKGKTMPGHMGAETITVQNMKIVKIDKVNNLIAVNGPVPGSINSFLTIREAVKKPKKADKKDDAKK